MNNKKVRVSLILIAMLLLIAIVRYSIVNAYATPNAANAQPAQSGAAANLAVSYPTYPPAATATPTATQTQIPTSTPTPLPTSLPTQTSTPTAVPIPCNLAGFVTDVTIPDGSTLNPGASFTKTWRLQNEGSCAWTTSYALVYSSGDLMNGAAVVSLPNNVNPGDTIDLSVNLTVPAAAGAYQGYWMLRDANGSLFGVGPDGSQPFWVKINVASSLVFAVTEVDTTANPTSYSGVCQSTFTFDANIWANGAGTVTYYWVRSDGSQSPEGTLTFTAAGYQTVSEEWTLGDPGAAISGWDEVYIDQPNQQTFSPAGFSLTCDAATPTLTDTPTQAPTFTVTPTATQPALTSTPTPAPTATLINTPTPTQSPTPTQPAPTNTPAATQTPTPTQPAPTNTPAPTLTPTITQPAQTTTATPAQTVKP